MSDLTLVIGNKNYSSWSLRPCFFMQQNQVSFAEKRVALYTDTMEAELAEYESDSKVPILKDGDLIVWDSLSILEYVSEQYLDGKGWPVDPKARAIARSISAEMHSSFSNVRNDMPMNCRKQFQIEFSEETQHEIERIKTLWQKCRTEFGAGGEWLFGEFSIADAMYAPIVIRFNGYGVPLDGIEKAYVENMLNNPHIQAWTEAGKIEKEVIDEDEI